MEVRKSSERSTVARLIATTFVLLLACGAMVPATVAQEYNDPEGKYRITLSGDWKAVSYSDAIGRQKTEFVYRDRSEGLLKITREKLNGPVSDVARQEEENLKIYRAGFERSGNESFGGGNLTGIRLSFFSTDGPRKTANTYYYLEDKDTVWVLRFSGKRGTLDTNRNVTDQIARSFKPM
ncbi:MAG TPA: hypothetical protein VKM94_00190 [Blastocatellia bacterium]|nr:hypothetical protein [Blastocatellia bacterium]